MAAISTIGVKVCTGIGTYGSNTLPSTVTQLPDVKSIGEITRSATALDATALSDTEKKNIPGLPDVTDSVSVKANNTDAFRTAWDTYCASANAANANGWIEVVFPDSDKAYFFSGRPSKIGLGSVDVNSVSEISVSVGIEYAGEWATPVLPS